MRSTVGWRPAASNGYTEETMMRTAIAGSLLLCSCFVARADLSIREITPAKARQLGWKVDTVARKEYVQFTVQPPAVLASQGRTAHLSISHKRKFVASCVLGLHKTGQGNRYVFAVSKGYLAESSFEIGLAPNVDEGESYRIRLHKFTGWSKRDSKANGVPRTRQSPPTRSRPHHVHGATITLDCGKGVTMRCVLIPKGRFKMGGTLSAAEVTRRFGGKQELRKDEHPRETVVISRSFYLGAHEVTRGQFSAFVRDTGYRTDAEKEGSGCIWKDRGFWPKQGASWRGAGFAQTDDHPAVNVSWNDATAFCRWLSRKSHRAVRLPTEAEWEYACRAGTSTVFPWGNDPNEGHGWANVADTALQAEMGMLAKKWPGFTWHDGHAATAPVGRFRANTFGVYDMIGNVREWCGDWYSETTYSTPGRTVDPTGPASGKQRVIRGGSWFCVPMDCRCAGRVMGNPNRRAPDLGFRVVVIPPTAE
jgi:formylglycine-generating enzyme required for sulfatase activity